MIKKVNTSFLERFDHKSHMATFTLQDRTFDCPVELAMSILSGKWKVLILWKLLNGGALRYSDLHRGVKGITHKMLAQQLRELETDGLVHREVYAVVPPKVEYWLTEEGQRMEPVLQALQAWGQRYKEKEAASPAAAAPVPVEKPVVADEPPVTTNRPTEWEQRAGGRLYVRPKQKG